MKNNNVKMHLGDANETSQNKYEFLKGFAHRIENNLSRYGRITGSVIVEAKMKGIVIVHAEDEECINFHGAINQEVASTMLNSCEQEIKIDSDGIALDNAEEEYSAKIYAYRYSFDWSWLFKIDSNIQFEAFSHITKDGVKWCQGIVFYLDELSNQKIIDVECKETYGIVVSRTNFDRTKVLIIGNKVNNLTIEMALDKETDSPLVIYKNKTFVLPWLDILALAMKSDLFAESELNVEEEKKNGES